MLDCSELLAKLNENPHIEHWFKENLSKLIPNGFEAIAEMIGAEKTQKLLDKTAYIVQNSIMKFGDLNTDKGKRENEEKEPDRNDVQCSVEGRWNGGFVKHEGKKFFTGAYKAKNGLPNFIGELTIDSNSNFKVQNLIHEFFGHLVAQVIEPRKIGDKSYAIDGFYMFEISEKGEIIETSNSLIGEGFAELVSEKLAEKCGVQYPMTNPAIGPLINPYYNGYQAAKLLCLSTNNKALEYNFEGTPYVLQQDMDRLIRPKFWERFAKDLDIDYYYIQSNPKEYNPEYYLPYVQAFLSRYFAQALDLSDLSVEDFLDNVYIKTQRFQNESLIKNYKLNDEHIGCIISRYIESNLGSEYSETEKIKHALTLNDIYKVLNDNYDSHFQSLNTLLNKFRNNTISKEEENSLLSGLNHLKRQKDAILNTTIAFSEDLNKGSINESIMFIKSQEAMKISFLKIYNNLNDTLDTNHLSHIYSCSDISLNELKNLSTSKDLDFKEEMIKQELYKSYSKDGRLKKFFKIKAGKIKESDIPESYIFKPSNTNSIYIFSKTDENEYDIHYTKHISGEKLQKLNISQPQKVGVNTRKRDLSFICPESKQGAKEQKPAKSIHSFVSSKESVHNR